ncbi:hypothetical protein CMK12_06670 [Candidatus Poribacteria bacterium]|nr:hypothetical protein [Candidatus Poribacteria bacterium]
MLGVLSPEQGGNSRGVLVRILQDYWDYLKRESLPEPTNLPNLRSQAKICIQLFCLAILIERIRYNTSHGLVEEKAESQFVATLNNSKGFKTYI